MAYRFRRKLEKGGVYVGNREEDMCHPSLVMSLLNAKARENT